MEIPLRHKLFGLLALALVLGGSAEWVFRGIQSRVAKSQSAEFHPYLQAVPKPGEDKYLRINRWGFRGEAIQREKPAGTFRIFVLGGSTVYCERVAFEKSHCRLLEKTLRERVPHLKVEVQNAGMHWHTSQHSLIKFLTQVQDFDPDMIVVYHGINDLCRSFSPPSYARPGYRRDYGHYDGPVARMVAAHRGENPLVNSLVLETITTFVDRYCYSDFRNTYHVPVRDVTDWPSLDAFGRNMDALAQCITGRDMKLVMATQPSLYKEELSDVERAAMTLTNSICRDIDYRPSLSSLHSGMQAFNSVSREIANQHEAVFVDLDAAVPKDLKHFFDDVHYTEAGNRAIAERLAEAILNSGASP